MRGLRLAGGSILLAAGIGGLLVLGFTKVEGFAAGGGAAVGMLLVVGGVLAVLSGLSKDSSKTFDPQATLNAHAWGNDEQPWSVGEALGMAFWTFRKIGGSHLVVQR